MRRPCDCTGISAWFCNMTLRLRSSHSRCQRSYSRFLCLGGSSSHETGAAAATAVYDQTAQHMSASAATPMMAMSAPVSECVLSRARCGSSGSTTGACGGGGVGALPGGKGGGGGLVGGEGNAGGDGGSAGGSGGDGGVPDGGDSGDGSGEGAPGGGGG